MLSICPQRQRSTLMEAHERFDYPWVELFAGPGDDLFQRLLRGAPGAIGAVACNRIEAVSDGSDGGSFGDLLALEAGRVATSVPPLMVGMRHDFS